MKRANLSALLATVAVATLASLAYAQTLPRPPSIKLAPAGVSLKSVDVTAKCGQAAQIQVAVSYSKVLAPTQVSLWGSIGHNTVEIPSGTGVKTFSYTSSSKLICDGTSNNYMSVLNQWVVLGDRQGMSPGMGGSFSATSSTTYTIPE